MSRSILDSGFKDRIADKVRKKIKSPWNFQAPQYDQRTSSFIQAGDDHGVGFNQPVGHHGDPKVKVDCLPSGRVNTLKDDCVYKGKMNYQIEITNPDER